jgi:hypothetical protein
VTALATVSEPTVADLLHEAVRLRAAAELVGDRERQVRDQLETHAAKVEADTGTVPNLAVKGVARAQRTEPGYTVRVLDSSALAAFLDGHPLADEVDAEHRVTVDAGALQLDVDRGEVGDALLHHLAPYLSDEVVFSESLSDVLLAACRRTDDGLLVTGDGELVAGVTVEARSRPQFRVTTEKGARERAKRELVGPVRALTSGDAS